MVDLSDQELATMASGESAGDYGRKNKCNVVLAENGKNFSTWKTLIPIFIQAEQYAWEVTRKEIKCPEGSQEKFTPEQKEQFEKYQKGNRAARAILFGSMHPMIIMNCFYGETEDIEAPDIWTRIKTTFAKKGVPTG